MYILTSIPYSLGDAIDWKLALLNYLIHLLRIPYSLGDAIDWKRGWSCVYPHPHSCPLLARGRDRLETQNQHLIQHAMFYFPYSLGDAIDWKQIIL